MATNPSEIVIGNKTLPLFSRKQLDCMSPNIMRQRALDIKDAAGLDCSVPRHAETLAEWILQTQNDILEYQGRGGMGQVEQQRAQPESRAAGRSSQTSNMGNILAHSEYAPSEAGGNQGRDGEGYAATRGDAMRAKVRNQGAGNILSWA
jgi:hypothetical protein